MILNRVPVEKCPDSGRILSLLAPGNPIWTSRCSQDSIPCLWQDLALFGGFVRYVNARLDAHASDFDESHFEVYLMLTTQY